MANENKASRASIGGKLAMGFGTVVLIALILGLIGVVGINRLSDTMGYVAGDRFSDLRSLAGLNYQRMVITADTLDALRAEGRPNRDEALRRILARRRDAWGSIDEHWNALLSYPRQSEEGRQLLGILEVQYKSWRQVNAEMDRLLDEITKAVTEERKAALFQEYSVLAERVMTVSDAMGSTFVRLTGNNDKNTALVVEGARREAERAGMLSYMTMFLGVFAAIAITAGISRGIVRPLSQTVSFLSRLTEGDLRADIPVDLLARPDELGTLAKAVQELTSSLRDQISSMKDMATALAGATYRISESVSSVTAAAEESGAAVVETSAAMEEVRTTAEITSKKTKEVAESAQQGLQVMKRGRGAEDSLFSGMKLVSERMNSIAETIMQLNEQSQEVGEITGTVEDLAEQSNLLAINAAVEAAKAGEQGRGFSVVAREIKSLAEQSKQSAKEVQRILRDIRKATSASVMVIEQGSKAVEQWAVDAVPSKESIQNLTARFVQSAQSAAQIAAANNELLSGMDQVAQAMESIRTAGEQNVAMMKDLESASVDLKEMGRNLSQLVERYRL